MPRFPAVLCCYSPNGECVNASTPTSTHALTGCAVTRTRAEVSPRCGCLGTEPLTVSSVGPSTEKATRENAADKRQEERHRERSRAASLRPDGQHLPPRGWTEVQQDPEVDPQGDGCRPHIQQRCCCDWWLEVSEEWGHALTRIAERCPDLQQVRTAVRQAELAFRTGSTAVRVAVLPEHRGDVAADYYSRSESNGNEVWAIIRDGHCTTVMLRRSNQPKTADAMHVDQVRFYKGAR